MVQQKLPFKISHHSVYHQDVYYIIVDNINKGMGVNTVSNILQTSHLRSYDKKILFYHTFCNKRGIPLEKRVKFPAYKQKDMRYSITQWYLHENNQRTKYYDYCWQQTEHDGVISSYKNDKKANKKKIKNK